MPRTRLAAIAATISCVFMLGAAGSASAATTTQTLAKKVPMTGTAKNGKKFTGTFTIQRFARKNGQTVAVGRLSGRLKHRHVSRTVSIPTNVSNAGASAAQITPTPNACQILKLDLAPIDLNLLGLRVRTNEINLFVEGVRGPGNLLGNLLCGITGLLDPNALSSTPLGQLTQILNALLALSPRTA